MALSVEKWIEEALRLEVGLHHDPHVCLGLHQYDDYHKEIRFFAPRQEQYLFEYQNAVVEAKPSERPGFFSYLVPYKTSRFDYRILYPSGLRGFDPYNFSPIFSTMDEQLFSQGVHTTIYEVFGAHVCEHEHTEGVRFVVWAPNAVSVCVVGDFNRWKEYFHPMRRVSSSGVWELFIPGQEVQSKYKYAIRTQTGKMIYKADPFAHAFELRPKTASIVTQPNAFHWRDGEWMNQRRHTSPLNGPMNIYEVHFGSWQRKKDGTFPNYREMGAQILPYLKQMGYTHLEIMPVTEHPHDESWGYQVTGYFAPTSRYGTLEDFQSFVDHLHMHGIGVILDWAPGHFPRDEFALARFDGNAVFEVDHSIMGIHPQWDSLLFNYEDKRVRNFLIGSALFWIDKMHIDGIRVDAVESMMYLNYCRTDHQWVPNAEGGNENLGAIAFLKELNQTIHEKFPGVFTIAEDASIRPKVTKPIEWGGLGFDLKWNMGWMNDTLRFMQRDPIYRKYHMEELLGSFDRAFENRYILPVSHDEVVHEKRSLIEKMPLSQQDQFAQMRLYYSAALCHPGKTLFFMGCEFGQRAEWSHQSEIHWNLLEEKQHREQWHFVREANHFYLDHPALWQIDFDQKGFEWIARTDYNHSVISYLRRGIQETLICVHNYTKYECDTYLINFPGIQEIKEVFNTDDRKYSGLGKVNSEVELLSDGSGFFMKMPSLATVIFSVVLGDNEHAERI